MAEGLNVVLVGIVGVFANLIILMLLMNLMGTVLRAVAARGSVGDDENGKGAE
jgi:Na+-transporting methylmalonyl-CoA/oxaloacetate decarboxylase gamma subunit